MKQLSPLRWALSALLLLLFQVSYAQTEGTLGNYQMVVCPGERTTITLSVSSNVTVDSAPDVKNGNATYPVKNTNTNVISCEVVWFDRAEQGTLTFKVKKEVSSGNFQYFNSPTATVNIKSVRDQLPAPINGMSSLSVPVCTTGQPITFSVPQEYFKAVPTLAITDYVWQVPTGWQVVNPQTSAAFPGGYLAGNSLSVIPLAGTVGGTVVVYQYSRACNENPAFTNAQGTLVSLARPLAITRPQPTLTAIAASRSPLYCGDTAPLTLTATLSQGGGTTVVYNWPATLPNGGLLG